MANKKLCYLYIFGESALHTSLAAAKLTFALAVKAGRATAATVRFVGSEHDNFHLSVGPRGAVRIKKATT